MIIFVDPPEVGKRYKMSNVVGGGTKKSFFVVESVGTTKSWSHTFRQHVVTDIVSIQYEDEKVEVVEYGLYSGAGST